METLQELLMSELKDIYSAENQLSKALPKMAKLASTQSLKEAFTTHLEETKNQIARLDQVGAILGMKKMSGKTCQAMKGLIEEAKEILDEGETGPVVDAALIGAAQRVEHYEMAAYGVTRALAKQLGYGEAVTLLAQTLAEETATDKKLTKIAEKDVLPQADTGEDEDEDEAEDAAEE